MPTGPKGQKRPADVVSNAVKVMRIATGELSEDGAEFKGAKDVGREGGMARAEKMSPERRSEIAKKAAATRWQAKK